ncbi:MAG: lysylphosphatidylglycerol synthase transmembrane domain-containing protein [Anaerolineae bacterium]|jgi:hypothetical protein
MNGRLLNVLRVVISVGLLAFVLWTNDPNDILAELRQSDLRYLLAASMLFLLGLVVRAYRWLLLVRSLEPAVPFGRLLNLYFVGQFFSTFLPTTYGGDVVRALELTQDSDSSAAIGTVLLDRLTGLMMLALIGLVVLPSQIGRMERWLVWVLLGLMLAILGGGTLVIEGHFLRWLTSRLPPKLSLVGRGPLAKVYTAVTGCGQRAVLSALGVSIVFNVANVVINWLCGKAMAIGIGLDYFFVISPIFSISGLIPSIGGWGVRETLSTAIFGSVNSEKAAAWGIALGLVMLAAGLVGGIVYLVGSVHRMLIDRRSERDTPPAA